MQLAWISFHSGSFFNYIIRNKTPVQMDKMVLADCSNRLADMAKDCLISVKNQKVDQIRRFYLGLIQRQFVLLRDMSKLLEKVPETSQLSSFIIARCILDDFINVLYFNNEKFSEEVLIRHTASAFSKRFKITTDHDAINKKYFAGRLAPAQGENGLSEQAAFMKNPENNKYFSDVAKKTFKQFPSTANLVRDLPITGVSAANAGALNLWQYYSTYIHYSSITEAINRDSVKRKEEIEQLRLVLVFAAKTIKLCSDALTQFGVVNTIVDKTNVLPLIFEGSINIEDDDVNQKKEEHN